MPDCDDRSCSAKEGTEPDTRGRAKRTTEESAGTTDSESRNERTARSSHITNRNTHIHSTVSACGDRQGERWAQLCTIVQGISASSPPNHSIEGGDTSSTPADPAGGVWAPKVPEIVLAVHLFRQMESRRNGRLRARCRCVLGHSR